MDELKEIIKDYHRGIVTSSQVVYHVIRAVGINNPFIRAIDPYISIQDIKDADEMVEKLEQALNP